MSDDDLAVAFRPATSADARPLAVLATHVYVATYATDGLDAAIAADALAVGSVDALARRLVDPNVEVHVAEVAHRLVGFVDLDRASRCPLPAFDGLEVARLYVHPRFHRRGLGVSLLTLAHRAAALAGRPRLWLTAWAGNEAALAFYRRQGFVDRGRHVHRLTEREVENRVLVKAVAPRVG